MSVETRYDKALYDEEPLLALGVDNSHFKPETFREQTDSKVDNVKDVLIEQPIDYYKDGGSILSLEQVLEDLKKDLDEGDEFVILGEISDEISSEVSNEISSEVSNEISSEVSNEISNDSLISKIASSVKNIFSQIGEALNAIYRFVSNVISKSNTVNEVTELRAKLLDDMN